MTTNDKHERFASAVESVQKLTEGGRELEEVEVVTLIAGATDKIFDSEIEEFADFYFDDYANILELGMTVEVLVQRIHQKRLEQLRELEESRAYELRRKTLDELSGLSPLDDDTAFWEKLSEVSDNGRRAANRARLISSVTSDDFVEQAKRDHDDRYFIPQLFGELPFRPGTQSVIGSRTGGGKTAAQVSLAEEALRGDRRILFLTLEDTPVQIIERLILATFRGYYLDGAFPFSEPNRLEWPEWVNGRQGYPIPRYCVYAVARDEEPNTRQGELLRSAYQSVTAAIDEERLRIVDGRGYGLQAILDTVEGYAEDLVLIDYLQRLPAPEELVSQTRQVQIQQTNMQLTALAAKTETIFICSAQFRRLHAKDNGGKAHKYDLFNDESFREAGDIEQDAYNAIGIGKEEKKRTSERYFRVLKAREHNPGEGYQKLMFEGAYSLLRSTGEEWHEPKEEKTKKTTKAEGGDDEFHV